MASKKRDVMVYVVAGVSGNCHVARNVKNAVFCYQFPIILIVTYGIQIVNRNVVNCKAEADA